MMQMPNQQQQQYDRGKTIFSPDGRLFQVEYAKEAVKKGATATGLTYENGVVLAATRTVEDLRVRNPEKVFKVEDHAGLVTSGLVADGRELVDEVRDEAQKYLMTYDEEAPIQVLSKFIADKCQQFTQYGGVRPFGVSTLVGGVTGDENYVYQTDPSGSLNQFKAVAIGKSRESANEVLEERWEEDLSKSEAIELAVDALNEEDEQLEPGNFELCVVEEEFNRFEPEELSEQADI
jgi:proteasome alpha subunit